MNNPQHDTHSLEDAIEACLRYFALFKYPLTTKEIHSFTSLKTTVVDLEKEIKALLEKGRVYQSKHGFFSLTVQEDWSEERLKGNQRAEELLKKSHRYVRVIKQFPFVKGIAISGSLSKYSGEMDADIDYFIITQTHRLWITRTMLHIYKKMTFIRGHQHFYCMNYFVDESALEIKYKNIYTAIELATLIPVFNSELIAQLKEKNNWLKGHLPNHSLIQDERFLLSNNTLWIKRWKEAFINICSPKTINQWLMNLTDRKWKAKWQKADYPMENYNQAFLTTPHVSKNHPANYQKQVLTSIEDSKSPIIPVVCKG